MCQCSWIRLKHVVFFLVVITRKLRAELVVFGDGRIMPFTAKFAWYASKFNEWVLNCSSPEHVMQASDDASTLTPIHVVYASDPSGFVGLVASIRSVAQSLNAYEQVMFHIIVNREYLAETQDAVTCINQEAVSREGVTLGLEIHPLLPRGIDFRGLADSKFNRSELSRPEAFVRYYVSEYLPTEARRAIWLDTDTIVRSSLGTLYRSRMTHALAAVPLVTSRRHYFLPNFHSHFEDVDDKVFNTGVLLYDLEEWRKHDFFNKLEDVTRELGELDTLALNLVFQGRYDRLDQRWNLGLLGEDASVVPFIPVSCIQYAHVLHWKGPKKPWDPIHGPGQYYYMFEQFDDRDSCGKLLSSSAISE